MIYLLIIVIELLPTSEIEKELYSNFLIEQSFYINNVTKNISMGIFSSLGVNALMLQESN